MAELLDDDGDEPVIPPTEIDMDLVGLLARLEEVADVTRRAADAMEAAASQMASASEQMLRAARVMPTHITHDRH